MTYRGLGIPYTHQYDDDVGHEHSGAVDTREGIAARCEPTSMLLVMAETIAAAFTDVTRLPGEPAAHFIEDMFWLAADPNPDFLVVTS